MKDLLNTAEPAQEPLANKSDVELALARSEELSAIATGEWVGEYYQPSLFE